MQFRLRDAAVTNLACEGSYQQCKAMHPAQRAICERLKPQLLADVH